MKDVKIICQNDKCIHAKGDWTGNNYCWETVCTNPDGVVISAREGCRTKEITTEEIEFPIP
jgi:hypothetical protein